jgi:hypothetical protein
MVSFHLDWSLVPSSPCRQSPGKSYVNGSAMLPLGGLSHVAEESTGRRQKYLKNSPPEEYDKGKESCGPFRLACSQTLMQAPNKRWARRVGYVPGLKVHPKRAR